DADIGIVNAALCLLIGGAAFLRSLASSVAGGNARSRGWIALAAAAWLGVTVLGIGSPVGLSDAYREGRNCFTFLLVAGLPMIAVAIAALPRTRSLTPGPASR